MSTFKKVISSSASKGNGAKTDMEDLVYGDEVTESVEGSENLGEVIMSMDDVG